MTFETPLEAQLRANREFAERKRFEEEERGRKLAEERRLEDQRRAAAAAPLEAEKTANVVKFMGGILGAAVGLSIIAQGLKQAGPELGGLSQKGGITPLNSAPSAKAPSPPSPGGVK